MKNSSFLLSSLEEPVILEVLLQVDDPVLRALSRKFLSIDEPDGRQNAIKLSKDLNFLLTTNVTLNYEHY